jgi:hypothetical protein
MLIGKVRAASAGTLVLAPSEVQVTGTNGVTIAIYANNQDLVFDPDISTGGDEIILVNGTLVAFDVTPQFGHLQVHLELQGPSESMEINSRISLRN